MGDILAGSPCHAQKTSSEEQLDVCDHFFSHDIPSNENLLCGQTLEGVQPEVKTFIDSRGAQKVLPPSSSPDLGIKQKDPFLIGTGILFVTIHYQAGCCHVFGGMEGEILQDRAVLTLHHDETTCFIDQLCDFLK